MVETVGSGLSASLWKPSRILSTYKDGLSDGFKKASSEVSLNPPPWYPEANLVGAQMAEE